MVLVIFPAAFIFTERKFFDITGHDNFMDQAMINKCPDGTIECDAIKFFQRPFNLYEINCIFEFAENIQHR